VSIWPDVTVMVFYEHACLTHVKLQYMMCDKP
jgi:hypothetical protein